MRAPSARTAGCTSAAARRRSCRRRRRSRAPPPPPAPPPCSTSACAGKKREHVSVSRHMRKPRHRADAPDASVGRIPCDDSRVESRAEQLSRSVGAPGDAGGDVGVLPLQRLDQRVAGQAHHRHLARVVRRGQQVAARRDGDVVHLLSAVLVAPNARRSSRAARLRTPRGSTPRPSASARATLLVASHARRCKPRGRGRAPDAGRARARLRRTPHTARAHSLQGARPSASVAWR